MPFNGISGRLVKALGSRIRKHRHSGWASAGARACDWYLRKYWNQQNWDTRTNGEERVLGALADHPRNGKPTVVFDVGANTGEYALLAHSALQRSAIHCFEILPGTRALLQERVTGISEVSVATHGLSDDDGVLRIGSARPGDTQSRVLTPLSTDVVRVVECPVSTGDRYLAEHAVEIVDLLKIDTEGHEMFILEGFEAALNDSRVRMIQFEYGTTWIPQRRLLYEAYSLLEPRGFRIGRLFPDGVLFKSYDRLRDEHFRMGNYVAVHIGEPDLVDTLNVC